MTAIQDRDGCPRPLKMFEAEFVSKDSDQIEKAPNGEQAPMVYPGKEPRASDSVLAAAGMRVTARYSGAARACRLAGAISRLSAAYQQGLLTLQRKRTGGGQQVTVKHIHQQVNVTEGGQAVVAGDTVTRGPGERRRGMIEK